MDVGYNAAGTFGRVLVISKFRRCPSPGRNSYTKNAVATVRPGAWRWEPAGGGAVVVLMNKLIVFLGPVGSRHSVQMPERRLSTEPIASRSL